MNSINNNTNQGKTTEIVHFTFEEFLVIVEILHQINTSHLNNEVTRSHLVFEITAGNKEYETFRSLVRKLYDTNLRIAIKSLEEEEL